MLRNVGLGIMIAAAISGCASKVRVANDSHAGDAAYDRGDYQEAAVQYEMCATLADHYLDRDFCSKMMTISRNRAIAVKSGKKLNGPALTPAEAVILERESPEEPKKSNTATNALLMGTMAIMAAKTGSAMPLNPMTPSVGAPGVPLEAGQRVGTNNKGDYERPPGRPAPNCLSVSKRSGGFNVSDHVVRNSCNVKVIASGACLPSQWPGRANYPFNGVYALGDQWQTTVEAGAKADEPNLDVCASRGGKYVYAVCEHGSTPYFTRPDGQAFQCYEDPKPRWR